jgi:hypothetical protein
MLLESLFMKLGQVFLSISSWFVLIQSRALLEASMIGMKINDIFLLIPMFLGVVSIACVGRVLVVPCVGFVLVIIGVVKLESLPRFINEGCRRALLGPKDCEKSSKLIALFGFMPWLN